MQRSYWLVALVLAAGGALAQAQAQNLDTRFSCSAVGDDGGEKVTYADSGEIHLAGNQVKGFRWESALYRPTHGYDCDIDDEDGLRAEASASTAAPGWVVSLVDGRGAREKRGYNFERGVTCTIAIEQVGDSVRLVPACPALCGSRRNFSAIVIDLKSGQCRYP